MQNRYVGDIGDYLKISILGNLSPVRVTKRLWPLH